MTPFESYRPIKLFSSVDSKVKAVKQRLKILIARIY